MNEVIEQFAAPRTVVRIRSYREGEAVPTPSKFLGMATVAQHGIPEPQIVLGPVFYYEVHEETG